MLEIYSSNNANILIILQVHNSRFTNAQIQVHGVYPT